MKRLAFVPVVCIALCSSIANADQIGGYSSEFGQKAIKAETPQRFMFELKFTPYTPHIDHSKGLNGKTPFADLFNSRNYNDAGVITNEGQQPGYKLLTTVEFDVEFLRRFWGTVAVGLTTGFYRRTTHAFNLNMDGTSCSPLSTCVRSGDESGLNIVPLSALIIYRFDTLANHYKIPIVPYVKLGLAYYIWWMNDGNGILSASQKPFASPQSAYGGSFGFVLHPGIAIQLDFLERRVAKGMDMELGINHTYIFCELNYANVNGFGASNKLDLSDTMVNTGFAFEF